MKKVTVNLLSAALCTVVAFSCIVGNADNALAKKKKTEVKVETHSATGTISIGNKQYDTIEDAIKAAKEKLMTSSQQLFTKVYEQAQANAQNANGAQAGPDASAGNNNAGSNDDVVDGDYREV